MLYFIRGFLNDTTLLDENCLELDKSKTKAYAIEEAKNFSFSCGFPQYLILCYFLSFSEKYDQISCILAGTLVQEHRAVEQVGSRLPYIVFNLLELQRSLSNG